jgi:DNA-binding MarR family transcriptional regulator
MRSLFTQVIMSMARNLRHENLSLQQLAALHFIDMRGEIRVGEICDQLLIPQPAASRLISDMVDRGLLQRRDDGADRRAKVISLSARGRELIETISRQRVDEANEAMLTITGPVSERFVEMFGDLKSQGFSEVDPDKKP